MQYEFTHANSLLIASNCCCNTFAKCCASPDDRFSSAASSIFGTFGKTESWLFNEPRSDATLSVSSSFTDAVSNACETVDTTVACVSFCHSCSLIVNTLVGSPSRLRTRALSSRLLTFCSSVSGSPLLACVRIDKRELLWVT